MIGCGCGDRPGAEIYDDWYGPLSCMRDHLPVDSFLAFHACTSVTCIPFMQLWAPATGWTNTVLPFGYGYDMPTYLAQAMGFAVRRGCRMGSEGLPPALPEVQL